MADTTDSVLERAEQFAKTELAPLARDIDAKGEIPAALIKRMGELRYLGATFPEKYGGLGLDPVAYGKLSEVLGKRCGNARAMLTLQVSLVGESLLKYGTPEQIEAWIPRMARGDLLTAFGLTEPTNGTDARNVQTSYVKDGGHYLISGRKKWISFGAKADMFLVVARADDVVTVFIVERNAPGVSVRPMSGLLGMRGCYLGEIFFDKVKVPESAVLGGVGNGFRFVVNTALDHGRFSIAWAGIAIAQAALEAMVSYARQRTQFGKRIHEFQLVQGLIGDATTNVHAARALCLRAAELRKQGSPEAVIETAMAKYFASTVANQVAKDAVQVHGGNGVWEEFPVERYYREAKVLEIIEGTSQIQQTIAAKYAMTAYFDPSYASDRDRP